MYVVVIYLEKTNAFREGDLHRDVTLANGCVSSDSIADSHHAMRSSIKGHQSLGIIGRYLTRTSHASTRAMENPQDSDQDAISKEEMTGTAVPSPSATTPKKRNACSIFFTF